MVIFIFFILLFVIPVSLLAKEFLVDDIDPIQDDPILIDKKPLTKQEIHEKAMFMARKACESWGIYDKRSPSFSAYTSYFLEILSGNNKSADKLLRGDVANTVEVEHFKKYTEDYDSAGMKKAKAVFSLMRRGIQDPDSHLIMCEVIDMEDMEYMYLDDESE